MVPSRDATRPPTITGHVLLDLEAESYNAQVWIPARVEAAPTGSRVTVHVGGVHVDTVDLRIPGLLLEAAARRGVDLEFTGDAYAVGSWIHRLRCQTRRPPAPRRPASRSRHLTVVGGGAA